MMIKQSLRDAFLYSLAVLVLFMVIITFNAFMIDDFRGMELLHAVGAGFSIGLLYFCILCPLLFLGLLAYLTALKKRAGK